MMDFKVLACIVLLHISKMCTVVKVDATTVTPTTSPDQQTATVSTTATSMVTPTTTLGLETSTVQTTATSMVTPTTSLDQQTATVPTTATSMVTPTTTLDLETSTVSTMATSLVTPTTTLDLETSTVQTTATSMVTPTTSPDQQTATVSTTATSMVTPTTTLDLETSTVTTTAASMVTPTTSPDRQTATVSTTVTSMVTPTTTLVQKTTTVTITATSMVTPTTSPDRQTATVSTTVTSMVTPTTALVQKTTTVTTTSVDTSKVTPTTTVNATMTPVTTLTTVPPSPTSPVYNPPIFVEITFKMTWKDFCNLEDKFKKGLSALLSDSKSRIRYMNVDGRCHAFADDPEKAIVRFYVAKDDSSQEVNQEQTISAYELLKKHHKDKSMEEIDPEFKGKVEAVEIKGKDAPTATIIPTTPYSPPVTVIVIFKMSLDKFCQRKETFRENLAQKIGISPPTLIVFVNLRCRPNVAFLMDDSENVKVEFYVKGKDSEQADAQLTNKAYELLDDYVKNNKMGEIDPAFEGKVESLQIKGEEKPTARKSLLFNQNERLLMGVGAAAVIILIAVLILVVRAAIKRSRRQNSHQLNDEEVMAEEVANGNIELEPINETKAEIMVPPQYNSAKDGGVSDDGEKKDICPLAESERSSINELDIDRATEGPSVENPAFVHDEGESKKVNTDDVKIDEKKVDDTKTADNEDQTQTPTAETNAGYDDQSDSPSEENTSL